MPIPAGSRAQGWALSADGAVGAPDWCRGWELRAFRGPSNPNRSEDTAHVQPGGAAGGEFLRGKKTKTILKFHRKEKEKEKQLPDKPFQSLPFYPKTA